MTTPIMTGEILFFFVALDQLSIFSCDIIQNEKDNIYYETNIHLSNESSNLWIQTLFYSIHNFCYYHVENIWKQITNLTSSFSFLSTSIEQEKHQQQQSDSPDDIDIIKIKTTNKSPVRITIGNLLAFTVLSILSIFGAIFIFKILTSSSTCTCSLCQKEYILIAELAEGGYGSCFVVLRKSDRRKFVLKKIFVKGLEMANKAQREAKELRSLRHSNIVKYEDDFIHIENSKSRLSPRIYVCIVMEKCDTDLTSYILDRIDDQGLKNYIDEKIVISFLIGISSALRYCHSHRIAHRDVKTQNIFLTKKGYVRLGDFGLAKHLKFKNKNKISQAGTDSYMSPETIIGGRNIDEKKSDVWGLGLCLYEIMTLDFMFDREALIGLQAVTNPSVIDELLETVPKIYSIELRELLRKMLQIDPKDRISIYAIFKHKFLFKS